MFLKIISKKHQQHHSEIATEKDEDVLKKSIVNNDKSKDFINGILDRLLKKLNNEGKIKYFFLLPHVYSIFSAKNLPN